MQDLGGGVTADMVRSKKQVKSLTKTFACGSVLSGCAVFSHPCQGLAELSQLRISRA